MKSKISSCMIKTGIEIRIKVINHISAPSNLDPHVSVSQRQAKTVRVYADVIEKSRVHLDV